MFLKHICILDSRTCRVHFSALLMERTVILLAAAVFYIWIRVYVAPTCIVKKIYFEIFVECYTHLKCIPFKIFLLEN